MERVLRHHLGRALEASLIAHHISDTQVSVDRVRDRLDQAAAHVFAAGLAVAAAHAEIAHHGRPADAVVTR